MNDFLLIVLSFIITLGVQYICIKKIKNIFFRYTPAILVSLGFIFCLLLFLNITNEKSISAIIENIELANFLSKPLTASLLACLFVILFTSPLDNIIKIFISIFTILNIILIPFLYRSNFTGNILEIKDNVLFVEILDTNKLKNRFDKVYVPLEDNNASDFKVNDKIKVTYTGTIEEKTICVIERVFNIKKVW